MSTSTVSGMALNLPSLQMVAAVAVGLADTACVAVFDTGQRELALTRCGVVYFVQDVSYDMIRLLTWVGLVHRVRGRQRWAKPA